MASFTASFLLPLPVALDVSFALAFFALPPAASVVAAVQGRSQSADSTVKLNGLMNE